MNKKQEPWKTNVEQMLPISVRSHPPFQQWVFCSTTMRAIPTSLQQLIKTLQLELSRCIISSVNLVGMPTLVYQLSKLQQELSANIHFWLHNQLYLPSLAYQGVMNTSYHLQVDVSCHIQNFSQQTGITNWRFHSMPQFKFDRIVTCFFRQMLPNK